MKGSAKERKGRQKKKGGGERNPAIHHYKEAASPFDPRSCFSICVRGLSASKSPYGR